MTCSASIIPLDESGIRDRWADLEKHSVLQTPFSRLDYMEDLAVATERPIMAVLVQAGSNSSGNDDVAGALVLRSSKAGIQHVSPASFTPYSAIVARSLPSGSDVHNRDSWIDAMVSALGHRFGKVDLMLPPHITDIRPFQWARWEATPLYTFRIPLLDPARTLSGWSEGSRRTFTRMKEKYEIRKDANSTHEIVRLCLAGYERRGRRPPLPPRQLESLVVQQVQRGGATCYTLHLEGRNTPDAGVVVLGHAADAFYWIAGSLPGPGMTVLIGNLIQLLSEQGFEQFDLVGANTPSIAEFKRRLNPTLVPYFRVQHVRSPLLRIFLSLKKAVRS